MSEVDQNNNANIKMHYDKEPIGQTFTELLYFKIVKHFQDFNQRNEFKKSKLSMSKLLAEDENNEDAVDEITAVTEQLDDNTFHL